MSDTDLCPACGADCGIECESLLVAEAEACEEGFDELDDEPCEHEHDEWCEDFQGFSVCSHQHCMNCGRCRCPGYCDDHQTYNVRPPAETGGPSGE